MAFTYSDWTFYHDTYRGALDQNTYARMAIKAAGEIGRQTFGRAKTASPEMADALQVCECELVDAVFSFEKSCALLPLGITSINNDGFSVASSGGNSRTDSRESTHNAEIRQICRKHLLSPVNLLYAGVRQC